MDFETGPHYTSDNRSEGYEAQLSLKRLTPRLERIWADLGLASEAHADFDVRLSQQWHRLFVLLRKLYGNRYDFFYHLEQVLETLARAWHDRSGDLRQLDSQRLHQPDWFQSQEMVGGALYVDLFSENLGKLQDHIGYFKDLGFTYLHLMPLFAVRPGDNDGGYAISNYRSVDPRLGTIDDLIALAGELRRNGISLVLDFVFNHTADDHYWAKEAQAGNPEFQDYYYLFPDRTEPDRYEQSLRSIFPSVRKGNFTWHGGMSRWVWTTFNSFQWDLNYSNPAVFRAMLDEMLFIANTGVEILRLDAVAFIWKRLGTNCENLPEAHLLIQAFNAAMKIVAPGLIFKSEAIVHPDEVLRYISPQECELSYNPTLMALCWESLATRQVKLLEKTLRTRHHLPKGTAWVNYLRCHDDIGWTFDDEDARSVGIDPQGHRHFLNQFYTGEFQGSFARGIPFQYDAATGDMRISGTMASLAGLEKALDEHDPTQVDLAIKRILLLYSLTLSAGGIPLLYVGEEWGTINDYDFVRDPAKSGDTRWVHRPRMDWKWLHGDAEGSDVRRRLFSSLKRLIELRKNEPAFSGNLLEVIPTENESVLGYVRSHEGRRVVVLANFSERPQEVAGNKIRTAGIGRFFQDLVTGNQLSPTAMIPMQPYQSAWLLRI